MLYPIGIECLIDTHIEYALLDAVGLKFGIRLGFKLVEHQAACLVDGPQRTIEIVFVEIDCLGLVFRAVFLLESPHAKVIQIHKHRADSRLEHYAGGIPVLLACPE